MSKRRSFKGWELQDFQKYCNDNYAGMSRSEVQRADPGFYQIVRNKGFTDEVLPKSKLRDFTGWELQDYKDHTNDNYAGMSRSEIRYIDRIFYGKIRREGFIDEVLPESKKMNYTDWRLQDYKDYVNNNYAGMSRTEIEKANSGLYKKIGREGFTDEVLPKSKLRDFTGWGLQDYKDYMNDNYAGMSRTEIADIDRIFYGKIRREGFIDEVLPESKKRNFTGWELQDYKDHMNDNYAGMSRSEIGKADPGFYRKVRKKGFTDEVLPGSKKKPNDYWKDTENVQKGLEPIIEELGRFPTWSEIDKRNSTLNVSINKYHGSLTQVRIKLGYAEKEMEVLKEILEELGNA
ncbi:hypothetical protein HON71_04900 [Candidatus Woesearchaeota archaeon]|jgi:hypothetical protein|nr:hypothetical protein [Candidatus Woesearchaeota archaeon]MBT5342372.1 hypothetical protein [Candidatus Woesearchaeota archaeon]